MLRVPDRQAFIVQGAECKINSNDLCASCFPVTLSAGFRQHSFNVWGHWMILWSLLLCSDSKWGWSQWLWHMLHARGLVCKLAVCQKCKMHPTSWASLSAGDRRETTTTQQSLLLVFQDFNILLAQYFKLPKNQSYPNLTKPVFPSSSYSFQVLKWYCCFPLFSILR